VSNLRPATEDGAAFPTDRMPPAAPPAHPLHVTTVSADPNPPPPIELHWLAAARARSWRYLRFLGCPADLADDFAQETVLAALREFNTEPAPAAWLCTTARNRLRMHLRTAQRELPDLETLHAQWVEVAQPDGGQARLAALQHCLQQLPERSRRALELRYGEGAERPAIGRELGLGEEGVKSLLVRLRATLAACVQKRVMEEQR